jgi:O-antigen/teichoic acid export membrane protein
MVVMALSGPGIFCLFGTKYSFAPLFLTLLALSYVFTAFGSLTVSNLINGQGKTRFTLKLGILNAAIGFPLSIVLVWQMGVVGIIVTTLVSGLPSLFIALRWIKKHYSIDIDWVFSAKILFSSSLAAVVTFMIQAQSWFSSWINLLFGAVVFSIIFFPSMVLTRTISKGDIENLREMTTTLEPINRLINPALNLIEKILVFVNRLDRESCALF